MRDSWLDSWARTFPWLHTVTADQTKPYFTLLTIVFKDVYRSELIFIVMTNMIEVKK